MKMPIRVLICDPLDAEGVEKLKHKGFEVDVKPSIAREDLEKIVSEYDVLVVRSRTKVTRDIIERGRRLKAIGRAGTGLDNIDLEAAEMKGVTVLNTPEAPADSVAELTIGFMLALARKIAFADCSMKEGRWLKNELNGSLLKGKTLGLIGLGNVGTRVAKIAKEIGMHILITKRTPPSPEQLEALKAEFVPLEELLRRSDIVSVHVPLTQETVRMIGVREVSLMKDGALLVNTSRGNIVDEDALREALKSGKLGGAALDVYEFEPLRNLELVRLPNVVCTPHIGAQTKEAQKAASILIAEKIIRFFEDQPT
jgi:D-3-phosphoglycerate dehydrogenase